MRRGAIFCRQKSGYCRQSHQENQQLVASRTGDDPARSPAARIKAARAPASARRKLAERLRGQITKIVSERARTCSSTETQAVFWRPNVTYGCDYHVHTKYLGCANETMEIPAILKECERLGVTSLAITDHLHGLDQLPLHAPIRRDILASDSEVEVYFGVELDFTGCDKGFPFSEQIKAEHGFQFAIGGIHDPYLEQYDLKKLVDIQHRHHLRTCQDPLVEVLVHPYWFNRSRFERNGWPWFDSMKAVPEAYARELGQASRDSGTAIEINAGANLVNAAFSEGYVREYHDYLAILAEEGAIFALGSDAHDISHLARIRASWQMADKLGLDASRIWRPPCEPLRPQGSGP